MMLGTAANSSIMVPIGRRRNGGHSSVRKTATPSASGTPISIAMSDVTSVPKIAGNAPYWSSTGFQAVLTRKPRPKWEKAGQAPIPSATMTPPNNMRTRTAKPRVALRNKIS